MAFQHTIRNSTRAVSYNALFPKTLKANIIINNHIHIAEHLFFAFKTKSITSENTSAIYNRFLGDVKCLAQIS